MTAGRTLRLYSPLALGSPIAVAGGDVTEKALGWSRSIRRDGGYWRGSFTLTDKVSKLTTWFYEYLGCHFEEKSEGFLTWEGLIYEMDLTVEGVTRRRTLDKMYNYVTSKYIDENNDRQTSSAAESDPSQARYGQREEILLLDGYPQAAAEGQRDAFLLENAWPWARTVGGTAAGNAEIGSVQDALKTNLVVTVCGYVFTGNWRFEQVGDGSTDDLSTWITEIVDTDFEFLSAGTIEANTRQVVKDTNIPQRAYDVVNELASLGNSDSPARFYVDNGRRAFYRTITTTPELYLRGGKFYGSAGGSDETNPWRLKPAVARDMDYPISKVEYGGWLGDARDFYISEFTVSDSGITYQTDEFDESELLANQMKYEKMLEDMAERA